MEFVFALLFVLLVVVLVGYGMAVLLGVFFWFHGWGGKIKHDRAAQERDAALLERDAAVAEVTRLRKTLGAPVSRSDDPWRSGLDYSTICQLAEEARPDVIDPRPYK